MQAKAGKALHKALVEFEKSQSLENALKKLKMIREVVDDLKGDDADYPTVEEGLEEIERILDK